MESVMAAAVTGVLTLAGVLVSNSKHRVVIEVKLDELTARVEKHNRVLERTYALERDVAVAALAMAVLSPVMAELGAAAGDAS